MEAEGGASVIKRVTKGICMRTKTEAIPLRNVIPLPDPIASPIHLMMVSMAECRIAECDKASGCLCENIV